jgi:NitT/TauT family transport system substrate-binding protein
MHGRPNPLARRRLLLAGAITFAGFRAAQGATIVARLAASPDAMGLADYPYWVARQLRYFGDLEATFDPGMTEAVRQVDAGHADIAATSPGRFAMGLEQGMRLVSVFQVGAADPLGLAFRKGEAVAGLKAMGGKTLLLDAAARAPFCDVLFAQAGLEAGAVSYVEGGPAWGQALAQGKGDAALAWDGVRAQWAAQGLAFDTLRGASHLPGRCLVVRAKDFAEPASRKLLQTYFRGWAMGLAFAERNPRAAAHAVWQQNAALAAALPPPVAVAALMQIAAGYRAQPWGTHDPDAWALQFRTMRQVGQTGVTFGATSVTNDLIAAANDFSVGQVDSDADRYELPPDFAQVDLDALRPTL